MNEHYSNYVNNRVLKIQIGFLLNETVGESRDTEFDVPHLLVDNDLLLEHLSGKLHFSRNSRGVLVQGKLHAQLHGECTRCLEQAPINVELPIEELYVSPPQPDAEFSIPESGILDLAPLIREEVIVQTPITVLCRPDCAGLCPTCGANLNEGPCDCERDTIDPRLAALKALRDQLQDE
ncbi:MAG: DUF177 domain-containing protein [Anaerolineae bacterium]